MMKTTSVIKICKIDSLNFASYALKQNVDFLGVHIITKKDIGRHKELSNYISSLGNLVIVTKIEELDDIKRLIEFYQPQGIQLHYSSVLQATAIKRAYPNLNIFGVFTDEIDIISFVNSIDLFSYVIYDKDLLGGTNKTHSYKYLEYFSLASRKKILLAGGINFERIKELQTLQIAGFDIQSYFREESDLNFRKLDRVCDFLKGSRKSKISVSLTDLPLLEIANALPYYRQSQLEYHLDYSLGTLYPSFNTLERGIEEKCLMLVQIPFSIHLFVRGENSIVQLVKKFSSRNKHNLTRIFIQYYEGLAIENLVTSIQDIKVVISIYHEDLYKFLAEKFDYQFISIIVPNIKNIEALSSLLNILNGNKAYFENKEVWFDRNLTLQYITKLNQAISFNFNAVIGKEVVENWQNINDINEYLHK